MAGKLLQFSQPRNFACRISHLVSPGLASAVLCIEDTGVFVVSIFRGIGAWPPPGERGEKCVMEYGSHDDAGVLLTQQVRLER